MAELVIVKGYTPEQFARLHQLEILCFRPSFRWSKEDLAAGLADGDVWVGVYDGVVVGYVLVEIEKDTGHIISLNVDPSYRRKGFATALMGAAESHCRQQKVKKLQLEVHVDNPAQLLYFNLGYRPSGFEEGYYGNGDNALVMTKLLKRV